MILTHCPRNIRSDRVLRFPAVRTAAPAKLFALVASFRDTFAHPNRLGCRYRDQFRLPPFEPPQRRFPAFT